MTCLYSRCVDGCVGHEARQDKAQPRFITLNQPANAGQFDEEVSGYDRKMVGLIIPTITMTTAGQTIRR